MYIEGSVELYCPQVYSLLSDVYLKDYGLELFHAANKKSQGIAMQRSPICEQLHQGHCLWTDGYANEEGDFTKVQVQVPRERKICCYSTKESYGIKRMTIR